MQWHCGRRKPRGSSIVQSEVVAEEWDELLQAFERVKSNGQSALVPALPHTNARIDRVGPSEINMKVDHTI